MRNLIQALDLFLPWYMIKEFASLFCYLRALQEKTKKPLCKSAFVHGFSMRNFFLVGTSFLLYLRRKYELKQNQEIHRYNNSVARS